MAADSCTINVKLITTTDRGAKVRPAFRNGPEVWVALSLVELSANEDSETHSLSGPHWLFAQKGWL